MTLRLYYLIELTKGDKKLKQATFFIERFKWLQSNNNNYNLVELIVRTVQHEK